MSVALMSRERPPNVEFEERPVPNHQAAIEQGGARFVSVDFAMVRQIGSKDSIEFPAEEWVAKKETEAMNGRYPPEWAAFFRKKYEAFKERREAPVNGFPIREWASISRGQAETCYSIGIRSVEDLAAANEEVIRRLGMGGRALRDTAKAFLESRLAHGNAEQLAALKADNATKDETIKSLEQKLEMALSRLDALEAKRPPGRPRKDEAA
jgi:hypothetical protein